MVGGEAVEVAVLQHQRRKVIVAEEHHGLSFGEGAMQLGQAAPRQLVGALVVPSLQHLHGEGEGQWWVTTTMMMVMLVRYDDNDDVDEEADDAIDAVDVDEEEEIREMLPPHLSFLSDALSLRLCEVLRGRRLARHHRLVVHQPLHQLVI